MIALCGLSKGDVLQPEPKPQTLASGPFPRVCKLDTEKAARLFVLPG